MDCTSLEQLIVRVNAIPVESVVMRKGFIMEKATHWIDDRKLVLTNAERDELGSDYQHAYNVPCRMVRGKAKPLYVCPACNGTGDELGAEYDSCYLCRGAGGLPQP